MPASLRDDHLFAAQDNKSMYGETVHLTVMLSWTPGQDVCQSAAPAYFMEGYSSSAKQRGGDS